jgi:DNA polymerase I-like protein with 3'-5' exonuclease and polymerase domains
MPQNSDQEKQLWQYCGKDVVTMMLVKRGIDEHATRVPGLSASIAQAMRCIKPYLTVEFTGIRYDKVKLDALMAENDRLMMQYIRLAKILVGEALWNQVRGKAKGHLLSSSQQAVKYFHEILGYAVVYRSPKTKLPSLNAKALLKLRIKYPRNPVLTLVLLYRGIATETGSLKFNPMWSRLGEQIKQHECNAI